MAKDDTDYSTIAWPGFGKSGHHDNSKKSQSVRSQSDSPPGPYDSPYDSPARPGSDAEKDESTLAKDHARYVYCYFKQIISCGLRTVVCIFIKRNIFL